MKQVLVALSTLLAGVFVAFATSQTATAQQSTCPDGNGWTKIDSNDISTYPVAGATQYCFKAGSDNSQGCDGGLFYSWPLPDGACGLSHWSYFISSVPTATPTPTNTPVPTATPTPTVSASRIRKTFMCYDRELGSYWRIRNDGSAVSGTITWKINQSSLTDIGTLNPGQSVYFYTKECGVLTVYENGVSKGTATCNREKLCEETPTPTPTPTQVVTVTPTPTPTITLTPGPGRVAALEYQVSCDKDEVKAEMRFTNDGKPMENVTAEFDYNGNKKTATSNSDGWAIVIYPRDGENKLTGYADGFYKIEKTVEFPDCPTTGSVLGATTAHKGQVLGATSYAKTGVAEDALMQLSGVLGTLMISVGALLHAKQK